MSFACQVEEFSCPEDRCNTVFVEEKRPASPPLHLATGLGINSADFEGIVGSADHVTEDYGDSTDEEDRYKRMIEENPLNPLILKNYAQFLHEVISKSFSIFCHHLNLKILLVKLNGSCHQNSSHACVVNSDCQIQHGIEDHITALPLKSWISASPLRHQSFLCSFCPLDFVENFVP